MNNKWLELTESEWEVLREYYLSKNPNNKVYGRIETTYKKYLEFCDRIWLAMLYHPQE